MVFSIFSKRKSDSLMTPLNQVENMRNELIDDLVNLNERIESYKPDPHFHKLNYRKGFLIYKDSRAFNREANYHLGKWLHWQLKKTNKSISEIFNDVMLKRRELIDEHCMHNGNNEEFERDIHSRQLKKILKKAEKFIHIIEKLTRDADDDVEVPLALNR